MTGTKSRTAFSKHKTEVSVQTCPMCMDWMHSHPQDLRIYGGYILFSIHDIEGMARYLCDDSTAPVTSPLTGSNQEDVFKKLSSKSHALIEHIIKN